jgi:peptide/nickel transport system permease protein
VVNYIIRRLLWAVVLFIAVTIVTYIIFFIIPADPARAVAGKNPTPEMILRARHYLGIDKPVYIQYLRFLDRLVIHQDLGRSFANRESVNTEVGKAAPVTASLVFGGAIAWMMIALPIGILSALRPRSLLDRGAMIFILVGISAPVVWIGLLLQYFVGFKWGLTPNAGYCDVFDPPAGSTCGGPSDWAYHMILPWLTFAILFAASYARMIRANVLDTLGEDYVRTARAKGAPENVVIRRHVLRNALLPVVTMLGLDIGVALGGAIFTEAIFNLPGLGRLALNSVLNLDLPTMQGVVVFATLAIILLNLVVDVVYAYIDPRIRLA